MAAQMICATCGSEGMPRRHVPGSFFIEVLLWLCFLLPGVLYSVWRLSAAKKVCPKCGSTEMVPLTSPRGATLHRQYTVERPRPPVRDISGTALPPVPPAPGKVSR
jgi:predicted RNA-binding Zn-ribbon protein involved in translation (DUF1610 family)